MRPRVVVLLGILALSASAPAAATPQASRHAWLELRSSDPLTVRGHGFHRRERVRVVARPAPGERIVRRVRASRSGRFTVTFVHARAAHCARWSVTATGRRGSRVTLREIIEPDCVVD